MQELPSILEMWEKCNCTDKALRFITRKTKPALDPDDFTQECFIRVSTRYSEFDPARGDQTKTLEEQFSSWFYWHMRSARVKMIRAWYNQYSWRSEEAKPIVAVVAMEDADIEIEQYSLKLWFASQFEVAVSETEELDAILNVVYGVMERFGASKQVMLKNQSTVLKSLLKLVNEKGERPSLGDIAKDTGLNYDATSRAYEAALRQVAYQFKKYNATSVSAGGVVLEAPNKFGFTRRPQAIKSST